jgi:hypothetical protein
MTFRFKVLQPANGAFREELTITSKHAIDHWRLSFLIPGAKITYVQGGSLQRMPRGGVTVSPYDPQAYEHDRPNGGMPSGGDGQYGTGQRPPGSHPGRGGGTRNSEHEVIITVFGTGSPGRPIDCTFNGASCTFSS